MKHNLSWTRVQPGEYRTNAYDSTMTRVPRTYTVRKGTAATGGGWDMLIDGDWYGMGATMAEAKMAAQRHYTVVRLNDNARERVLARVVEARVMDELRANADKLGSVLEQQTERGAK